jgi:HAD superfamily phosphoserine phosphatase-like hydrolase
MDSAHSIPRATAAEIIARLEAELARASDTALLASDADGTIWDGDVGIDLFEALIAARGVREAAREALAAEARACGVSEEGDANTLTVRLYDAYKTDRYAHDRAFAMMAWAFAGWAREEAAAFCARVLEEHRIDARIRPEMLSIFRWADERGVPVFVVSASCNIMIETAAPRLGVPRDRVVAMTPALDANGVVLPHLDGPIVYGEGKLAALDKHYSESAARTSSDRRRAAAREALLGAFGDSTYDAAMLRASRVPVAVTPAPGLVALAPTIANLVSLAR